MFGVLSGAVIAYFCVGHVVVDGDSVAQPRGANAARRTTSISDTLKTGRDRTRLLLFFREHDARTGSDDGQQSVR